MLTIKFNNKMKSHKIVGWIFLFFILFSLAPDIIKIAGRSIKPMYFMFIALICIMISKKKFKMPPFYLSVAFGYAFMVSFCAAIFWGFDRLIFNYCFGFVILIIFLSLGKEFSIKEWETIFCKIWIALLILVLINDLIQAYRFVEYLQYGWNHPYISTVVTGGVNLESSWISILTLSFFHKKKRWIPVGISLAISLIYVSRVGTLATIMVATIFVFGKMPDDTKKKIFNRRVITLVMIFIGVIVMSFLKSDIVFRMYERFIEIGHDPGSVGRFLMWRYVPQLIERYPFGVGLGNSIQALETVSPFTYEDGNLHNLFMQMFCEIGVVGGFYYIGLWFAFLKKSYKKVSMSPFVGMLLIYGFMALFQYRGGETIFFVLVGIFLNDRSQKIHTNREKYST